VIDCFSRKVVGWSMRADMEAELVVDALEMAINRRQPAGSWSITPTRARNTSR
jgi:putative transposase